MEPEELPYALKSIIDNNNTTHTNGEQKDFDILKKLLLYIICVNNCKLIPIQYEQIVNMDKNKKCKQYEKYVNDINSINDLDDNTVSVFSEILVLIHQKHYTKVLTIQQFLYIFFVIFYEMFYDNILDSKKTIVIANVFILFIYFIYSYFKQYMSISKEEHNKNLDLATKYKDVSIQPNIDVKNGYEYIDLSINEPIKIEYTLYPTPKNMVPFEKMIKDNIDKNKEKRNQHNYNNDDEDEPEPWIWRPSDDIPKTETQQKTQPSQPQVKQLPEINLDTPIVQQDEQPTGQPQIKQTIQEDTEELIENMKQIIEQFDEITDNVDIKFKIFRNLIFRLVCLDDGKIKATMYKDFINDNNRRYCFSSFTEYINEHNIQFTNIENCINIFANVIDIIYIRYYTKIFTIKQLHELICQILSYEKIGNDKILALTNCVIILTCIIDDWFKRYLVVSKQEHDNKLNWAKQFKEKHIMMTIQIDEDYKNVHIDIIEPINLDIEIDNSNNNKLVPINSNYNDYHEIIRPPKIEITVNKHKEETLPLPPKNKILNNFLIHVEGNDNVKDENKDYNFNIEDAFMNLYPDFPKERFTHDDYNYLYEMLWYYVCTGDNDIYTIGSEPYNEQLKLNNIDCYNQTYKQFIDTITNTYSKYGDIYSMNILSSVLYDILSIYYFNRVSFTDDDDIKNMKIEYAMDETKAEEIMKDMDKKRIFSLSNYISFVCYTQLFNEILCMMPHVFYYVIDIKSVVINGIYIFANIISQLINYGFDGKIVYIDIHNRDNNYLKITAKSDTNDTKDINVFISRYKLIGLFDYDNPSLLKNEPIIDVNNNKNIDNIIYYSFKEIYPDYPKDDWFTNDEFDYLYKFLMYIDADNKCNHDLSEYIDTTFQDNYKRDKKYFDDNVNKYIEILHDKYITEEYKNSSNIQKFSMILFNVIYLCKTYFNELRLKIHIHKYMNLFSEILIKMPYLFNYGPTLKYEDIPNLIPLVVNSVYIFSLFYAEIVDLSKQIKSTINEVVIKHKIVNKLFVSFITDDNKIYDKIITVNSSDFFVSPPPEIIPFIQEEKPTSQPQVKPKTTELSQDYVEQISKINGIKIEKFKKENIPLPPPEQHFDEFKIVIKEDKTKMKKNIKDSDNKQTVEYEIFGKLYPDYPIEHFSHDDYKYLYDMLWYLVCQYNGNLKCLANAPFTDEFINNECYNRTYKQFIDKITNTYGKYGDIYSLKIFSDVLLDVLNVSYWKQRIDTYIYTPEYTNLFSELLYIMPRVFYYKIDIKSAIINCLYIFANIIEKLAHYSREKLFMKEIIIDDRVGDTLHVKFIYNNNEDVIDDININRRSLIGIYDYDNPSSTKTRKQPTVKQEEKPSTPIIPIEHDESEIDLDNIDIEPKAATQIIKPPSIKPTESPIVKQEEKPTPIKPLSETQQIKLPPLIPQEKPPTQITPTEEPPIIKPLSETELNNNLFNISDMFNDDESQPIVDLDEDIEQAIQHDEQPIIPPVKHDRKHITITTRQQQLSLLNKPTQDNKEEIINELFDFIKQQIDTFSDNKQKFSDMYLRCIFSEYAKVINNSGFMLLHNKDYIYAIDTHGYYFDNNLLTEYNHNELDMNNLLDVVKLMLIVLVNKSINNTYALRIFIKCLYALVLANDFIKHDGYFLLIDSMLLLAEIIDIIEDNNLDDENILKTIDVDIDIFIDENKHKKMHLTIYNILHIVEVDINNNVLDFNTSSDIVYDESYNHIINYFETNYKELLDTLIVSIYKQYANMYMNLYDVLNNDSIEIVDIEVNDAQREPNNETIRDVLLLVIDKCLYYMTSYKFMNFVVKCSDYASYILQKVSPELLILYYSFVMSKYIMLYNQNFVEFDSYDTDEITLKLLKLDLDTLRVEVNNYHIDIDITLLHKHELNITRIIIMNNTINVYHTLFDEDERNTKLSKTHNLIYIYAKILKFLHEPDFAHKLDMNNLILSKISDEEKDAVKDFTFENVFNEIVKCFIESGATEKLLTDVLTTIFDNVNYHTLNDTFLIKYAVILGYIGRYPNLEDGITITDNGFYIEDLYVDINMLRILDMHPNMVKPNYIDKMDKTLLNQYLTPADKTSVNIFLHIMNLIIYDNVFNITREAIDNNTIRERIIESYNNNQYQYNTYSDLLDAFLQLLYHDTDVDTIYILLLPQIFKHSCDIIKEIKQTTTSCVNLILLIIYHLRLCRKLFNNINEVDTLESISHKLLGAELTLTFETHSTKKTRSYKINLSKSLYSGSDTETGGFVSEILEYVYTHTFNPGDIANIITKFSNKNKGVKEVCDKILTILNTSDKPQTLNRQVVDNRLTSEDLTDSYQSFIQQYLQILYKDVVSKNISPDIIKIIFMSCMTFLNKHNQFNHAIKHISGYEYKNDYLFINTVLLFSLLYNDLLSVPDHDIRQPTFVYFDNEFKRCDYKSIERNCLLVYFTHDINKENIYRKIYIDITKWLYYYDSL